MNKDLEELLSGKRELNGVLNNTLLQEISDKLDNYDELKNLIKEDVSLHNIIRQIQKVSKENQILKSGLAEIINTCENSKMYNNALDSYIPLQTFKELLEKIEK